MYDNPPAAVAFADGLNVPEKLLIEAVEHFESFYEEVYLELAKYGELEELHVCDNIGEHLIGNVFAKFYEESDAQKAIAGLNGRYYAGRPIKAEYSPVTDFKEARCRLYNEGTCDRGGYCNFMHLKHVSLEMAKEMKALMYQEHPEYKQLRLKRKMMTEKGSSQSKSKERSRSRHSIKKKKKHKKRKHSSDRSHSKERHHKKRKHKHKRSRSSSEDVGDLARQSSAERRATIATWNQESDNDSTKDKL